MTPAQLQAGGHPTDGDLWMTLAKTAKSQGHEMMHLREARRGDSGALLALNPAPGPAVPPRLAPRILLNYEPPVVDPTAWLWPRGLLANYDRVFLAYDARKIWPGKLAGGPWAGWAKQTGVFRYPQLQSPKAEAFIGPRRGRVVMIAGNKMVRVSYRELYSRRLQALLAFPAEDVSLYGRGWDVARRGQRAAHDKILRIWRGPASSKQEVLRQHSFSIAFENMAIPGYVTEKIFDSLACGCIPIYYGAPDIAAFVPRDCFIDATRFSDDEELVEAIQAMQENEIAETRSRINAFLGSARFRRLNSESFAKNVMSLIVSGASLDWIDGKPRSIARSSGPVGPSWE